MVIALARRDKSSGAWLDDSKVLVHYRLTSAEESWLYGNVEQ
jgi:hypothetical protein